jgi:hypothetical protein
MRVQGSVVGWGQRACERRPTKESGRGGDKERGRQREGETRRGVAGGGEGTARSVVYDTAAELLDGIQPHEER